MPDLPKKMQRGSVGAATRVTTGARILWSKEYTSENEDGTPQDPSAGLAQYTAFQEALKARVSFNLNECRGDFRMIVTPLDDAAMGENWEVRIYESVDLEGGLWHTEATATFTQAQADQAGYNPASLNWVVWVVSAPAGGIRVTVVGA